LIKIKKDRRCRSFFVLSVIEGMEPVAFEIIEGKNNAA
jgi:hypothetical protein